jgi:LacI family transcriptional regulator
MVRKQVAKVAGAKIGGRATLRTIAELTGLSLSTVSLALRGGNRLKAETHQRVGEAAAKLGYVPNRAGVRLRTGKTNVIALVLERADQTIDFARFLIQGIGHGMADTQYHMNVTPEFGASGSLALIRNIMDNRLADGVIITHTSARDARVQLMLDRRFPFVSHGRTEFYSPHPYHDFNSEGFVRLALERMAAKGRRRVLLVAGHDATYNHHKIVDAFQRIGSRLGIEATVLGSELAPPLTAARELGQTIARMSPRPDGIICDSEVRSILMISGLTERGVSTSRDIHFICKQTSGLLPALYPDIDTIEEDVLAAGAELARLLIRRIAGEHDEALNSLGEPVVHWRN